MASSVVHAESQAPVLSALAGLASNRAAAIVARFVERDHLQVQAWISPVPVDDALADNLAGILGR
jgi:hypothetical protein